MTQSPHHFLITGASGWAGRRLVEYLHTPLYEGLPEDAQIRCLVLSDQEAIPLRALGDRVEVVVGDLRDPRTSDRLCNGAQDATLIHTAGMIHPGRVSEFHAVNVEGSASLLKAASAAGVRRAVVISSNSPLGCNPFPEHVFDEESPYHPYQGYGRSKMLLEQFVARFREEQRMETVILRPPWFYGPWQPPRQTLFFTMIRTGKMPIVGSGENRRSMVYVDNLCQGIVRAALCPQAVGKTYWIADRRPYTMNEIVDTVERLLESEFKLPVSHKRLRVPSLISEIAGVADSVLQSAGIYHQKIHVLSEMNKTIACTTAKAEREIGYNPEVSLEEGMRRSIAWCLDKGYSI
jgi:nucleoside-diphosphate-sugar epimerase